MYPTTYHRPRSLAEAAALHAASDEPAYLSGGHTLIPTMKARLAAPADLIDVRGIPDLHGIVVGADAVVIGAATTHAEVAASAEIARAIPALALLAGSIGDAQVRHLGTIGGSVANNDPAADYPAAVLGLGATIRTDRRSILSDDFFAGLYSTALEPGEILVSIRFPIPASAGYAKFRNPASRYALAASFVTRWPDGSVRVAVTGAGSSGVFRWMEAERALSAGFGSEAVRALAIAPDAMMSDMHAASDYRADLVAVMTRRAVEHQGGARIT